MADYFFLTDSDRRTLQMMLEDYRNRPRAAPNRGQPGDSLDEAVSVYVALTPASGIAALSPSSSGTGGHDAPHSAECSVYRMLGVDLVPIGHHETIYNLSTSAVPGGKYIRIVRDPWGSWYAEGEATGGGSVPTQVTIPTYRAQITLTTPQSLTDGVAALVTFDTKTYDDGGFANLGTDSHKLIAPVSGMYIVSYVLLIDEVGPHVDFDLVQTLVLRNGTETVALTQDYYRATPDAGWNGYTYQSAGVIAMASGDYVRLTATAYGRDSTVSSAIFRIVKVPAGTFTLA